MQERIEQQREQRANARAQDLLPRHISSALLKQGEAWLLRPGVIMSDVRESQELKREREQERRGY